MDESDGRRGCLLHSVRSSPSCQPSRALTVRVLQTNHFPPQRSTWDIQMGWGDLMTQTESVHAHALMRAPAARPLKRMFIRQRRTQPTGHFPFSHCPVTWSRENKRPCRRTFFTLRAPFSWPAGDGVGRDPSVMFSHGSFSCHQPPQQRPDGPVWGLLGRLTRQPRQLITVWPAIPAANIAVL